MEYENPRIPEGINVSPEHPLKEFFQLTLGMIAAIGLIVAVLAWGIGHIARLIPFEHELRLAQPYFEPLEDESEMESYLQGLADRLIAVHPLPPGITVQVHYVDSETVNAMATLGGQIVIFRGLLDLIPHENALAMVLAHEIAHVRHRDPIVGMGRFVVIGIALAAISGASGNDIVGNALGTGGILTLLSFTRAQERDADRDAVAALATLYGHGTGADTFFRKMLELPEARQQESVPQFLATHPLTEKRIAALHEYAADAGIPMNGATTPLPSLTLPSP